MEIPVNILGFQSQRISVERTFWKAHILLNGKRAEGKRGHYAIRNDAGEDVAVGLKFNVIDPIPKLQVGGDTIQLARPLTWYEYLWMGGIPILLVLTGGALGVLLGLAVMYTNARIFRGGRGVTAKYGLTALVSAAAFIGFVVVGVVLQLILGIQQ